MNKRFSLGRLIRNDKLMMIASLVLAIIVWSLVVFGPSNKEEQVVTGVPISITLNDYASETLKLRIVDGQEKTATVTVYGLRSVIGRLSAADLSVTADTGNIIKEGTYTLQLRAQATGDYTIRSVVGDDGTSDTVTVTCDVWRETSHPIDVEMKNLSVKDEKTQQFGTPSITSDAVVDGTVVLTGAKTDIDRVSKVVAVIDDTAKITEATVFTARLEARDADGNVINSVSFKNAEDGKVNVTIPIMVYRKIELKPSLTHTPAAYASRANLITVSPKHVEVWGVPTEIDDYETAVQKAVKLDFDHLNPGNLTQNVSLQTVEGIRPVNGNELIQLKVGLSGITSKKFSDVDLSEDDLIVSSCPEGYTVELKQTSLKDIVLCGTSAALGRVDSENIAVSVELGENVSVGQQTVKARVVVKGQNGVWSYYGEKTAGIDVLISVAQAK